MIFIIIWLNLWTAGLPLGPQRKQLEDLLTTISADKQSNIKLTIQHNKNFYAVAKSGEIDKVLSILGIVWVFLILLLA